MLKPETKPDAPVTYEMLNKFLAGTLAQIKRKEISLEEAQTIAKVSDKIIKNNLTAIMDKNRRNDKSDIEFFIPSDKQILIG